MKNKVFVLAALIALCLTGTSCMSSKAGCKMSQNYVGYGSRR